MIGVSDLLAPTADPQDATAVDVGRPSDALEARAAAKGQFTTLLLGLGAVALLVGAIGIANIMVISVLERRGEIGLRRALGATRRHIAAQFLTESALLAAIGGLAGLALGAGATEIYAAARHEPFVVPLYALIAAPVAGFLIGVLAGLYPATKATRLSPTEALRAYPGRPEPFNRRPAPAHLATVASVDLTMPRSARNARVAVASAAESCACAAVVMWPRSRAAVTRAEPTSRETRVVERRGVHASSAPASRSAAAAMDVVGRPCRCARLHCPGGQESAALQRQVERPQPGAGSRVGAPERAPAGCARAGAATRATSGQSKPGRHHGAQDPAVAHA